MDCNIPTPAAESPALNATALRRKAIDDGLKRMTEKARATPGRCFTLEEIARECGCSRERIRQIEAAGLRKVRNKRWAMKILGEHRYAK